MCPDKSVTYVGIAQSYDRNSPCPSYPERGAQRGLSLPLPVIAGVAWRSHFPHGIASADGVSLAMTKEGTQPRNPWR